MTIGQLVQSVDGGSPRPIEDEQDNMDWGRMDWGRVDRDDRMGCEAG